MKCIFNFKNNICFNYTFTYGNIFIFNRKFRNNYITIRSVYYLSRLGKFPHRVFVCSSLHMHSTVHKNRHLWIFIVINILLDPLVVSFWYLAHIIMGIIPTNLYKYKLLVPRLPDPASHKIWKSRYFFIQLNFSHGVIEDDLEYNGEKGCSQIVF